jgi:2-haloacid dehalogenase
MEPKWVSFDCFGTLMDWQTGFRRAVASVAGETADALIAAYHEAEHATQDADPTATCCA